jgi:transcriptional regulator with XRE-family HTH domain
MKTLSMKIRDLRVMKRVTQDVLAEHLGVVKATVSSWENGKSIPKIDKIKKIAKYFDVDVDYFSSNVDVEEFPELKNFGNKNYNDCSHLLKIIETQEKLIVYLEKHINELKSSEK